MRRATAVAACLLGASLLAGCAAGPPPPGAPAATDPVAQREHLLGLGLTSLERGRFEEAERRFRELLARDPDHPGARLGLTEALLGSGRPTEARDAFAAVLRVGAGQRRRAGGPRRRAAHAGRSAGGAGGTRTCGGFAAGQLARAWSMLRH